MRIIHALGWYFPDSVGGTEVYVEALCRRLRAAGHDVLVAAPDVARNAPYQYVHDGVRVFRYPIPAEPTRDEAYHRTAVGGAAAFHAWLAEVAPDILHVHSFTTGLGLPDIRAARGLGIRVIATCHLPGLGYMCRTGELMQWGRQPCDGLVVPTKCASCALTVLGAPQPAARIVGAIPPRVSGILGRLPGRSGTAFGMSASIVERQDMQRELFDLVERFVVLNDTARRMLVANGSPSEKLAINRLGLSQHAVVRKPGPDERPTTSPVRFGYLGRLHPYKGLIALARAVERLPPDLPFDLEIRGPMLDPESRRIVADLRARFADDPRVRLEPAVPVGDVPAALAALDVLVCPSLGFENGPTIVVEAFAAGTPTIASRVGNLAEIIDDGVNGRLVEAGDVAALAGALTEAATDPARTIDVWRRALPSARTMDDVARDYLALYAA